MQQRFQSSPGPKARCNRVVQVKHKRLYKVSILTGPEGPVQPETVPTPLEPLAQCFNPHRARRPGATLGQRLRRQLFDRCFNPHRARRPGATWVEHYINLFSAYVSILTGPEGPVQPTCAPLLAMQHERFQSSPGPKARCNKLSATPLWSDVLMFQSSPGPKARCNTASSASSPTMTRGFNPHRARRPGAT